MSRRGKLIIILGLTQMYWVNPNPPSTLQVAVELCFSETRACSFPRLQHASLYNSHPPLKLNAGAVGGNSFGANAVCGLLLVMFLCV